jgi:hypothetical protein
MARKIETYVLRDDLPKENPWRDDRLGYKPFCERLAKIILSLRVPNGYVIGLHGEWGSGKSTALNFIRAFLNKHNQEAESDKDQITLVDFRPWIVSGHQDLIATFFKVMAESLGVQPRFWRRQWNRLLRALKIGGDPLVDAVATVAVTVDPSGGVGTASKAVAPVFKKSLGSLIDKFLAEPSLQMAYEELRKRLAESGRCFLVTIDDIDRLQDDEIRSTMQMVKTVGRLPNVIYLLAYDRSIVWDVLDGELRREGPRFGEKIVQQEIELPRPSKDSLLAMLDEEIAFLIEHIPETTRWHYIVRDGVRRWVRHPRDLLRLANAVKFSWPALKGEIDAADLLAMEGLRLFDPEAFDWIRWNRDFLFSEGRFAMASEETDAAAAKRLKESLPEETREQLVRILAVLFPHHAKAFKGKPAMGEETRPLTAARRGVGYAPGYDAYFGLHPSSDAIPKAVVDGIIACMGDEDALRKAIEPYITKRDRREQPAIGHLLEELRYRFYGPGRPEPTQQLLDVLFEFGERVLSSDWRSEVFGLSPRAHLSFLVSELLEAWGQDRAGGHVLAAFKRSNSPAFCADVFVDRAQELGKMPDHSRRTPTLKEEDLQPLGEELIAKIERAEADGTLEDAPMYSDIARAWSYMGKPAEAKAWLSAGMLGSAQFLAKVTMPLVSYSISTRERVYTMDVRPEESLYDLQVLREACRKHLASSELNQDQHNRIRAVAMGIEKIIEMDAAKSATSL